MIIYLQKDFDGKWKPYEESDIELSDSIPPGEIKRFEFSSRRSLAENALFWSFLNFVYKQQEAHTNYEAFLSDILFRAGHGDTTYFVVNGERILNFKPKSLSFAITKHEEFHALLNKVADIIQELYGINLDEWKKNKDIGKCENPTCNNKASQYHAIFSDLKFCHENGWVVNVCQRCRNASMGLGVPENKISRVKQQMEYLWCEVKGMTYKQALKKYHNRN